MTFIKFLLTKAFLKQLGLALAATIVICFLVLWWLGSTTNHGQKIGVPDLAKMTLTQAEETLKEFDLRYEVLDSTNYNPEFPYKTVIEQIPAAGSFVKENRKIYISLNRSGYPMVTIPKVLRRTMRQAEPTLLAAGFKIGKVTERPHISDQVLELKHKGKRVQPGEQLQQTSVIDVVIGDGNLNRIETPGDDSNEQSSETESDGSGTN